MIIYSSAAEDEEKLINWVSRFTCHILNYQKCHKGSLLLILKEACARTQEYAPRFASDHMAPRLYDRVITDANTL